MRVYENNARWQWLVRWVARYEDGERKRSALHAQFMIHNHLLPPTFFYFLRCELRTWSEHCTILQLAAVLVAAKYRCLESLDSVVAQPLQLG